MTNPQGLHLVWADTGGVTDPTDIKYQTGWVAEIPTFQHFNYVLQGLDRAKLSYAESDVYPWQDLIAYQAGAKVKAGNKVYHCVTTHNDAAGSNPQDPLLDNTGSYWVTGIVFSGLANAYVNLLPKEGFKLDQVAIRTSTNLWESNDQTLVNKNCVTAMNLESGSYDNLLFGNVRGELVVVNVGNDTDPDSRTLVPANNVDSHKIYHEGYKPTQADVTGTIPDAPANGKIQGRQDNNWVELMPADSPIIGQADGYQSVVGERVVMNNSAAATTVLLPLAPLNGQWVDVSGKIAFSTFPVYVEGTTKNIMTGADTNCELDEDFTVYRFWYDASVIRWKIRKVSIEGVV